MKRFLFGFLAVLFLILNTIPYLHILADDMPTNSQYEMLGAYALSSLITTGEATELDFSDYVENDTSFLIDLGEAIFTGDWSGLAQDGLEWLGDTADNIYDSYKEYISQWKSDHLGIMYSNWFPDETIYVGPDDSYSLAKPLRELLTPRNDNTGPTPNPDPSYSVYLNNINGDGFWWKNYNNSYFTYNNSQYPFLNFYPPSNYSWFSKGNSSIPYTPNDLTSIACVNIIDINIYSIDDVYYLDTFVNVPSDLGSWYGTNSRHTQLYINNVGNISSDGNFSSYNSNESAFSKTFTSSGSLTVIFNYLQSYVRNVNIYVDGVPWSIVSSSEPTYPLVIPGQLTIWNDQPLQYSFPSDTRIILPDLTNIIRNAINSSGVVMWSDIADVFVDINGQTAVAVTKIVRNDYDNLYMEQYPYPAMLVGMTEQTKFNEHLLDNSHAYLSPMGTVVQETVNVLPSELVGVLAIGAILTIFAVIINRLLE